MTAATWEVEVATQLAAKWLEIEGVRRVSALATANLPQLPGVLVMPPEGELDGRSGNHEAWGASFPCYLIVSRRQPERSLDELTTILGRARVAWWDGIKLGLDYVTDSYMNTFTFDPEELAGYADLPAYRVDIRVDIHYTAAMIGRSGPRTA